MTTSFIHSIMYVFYSYFSHNYIFLAYAFGLAFSIGLSIYKPSRFLIFSMIGFGILCFAFQYDKHFALQVSNEIGNTIKSKDTHASIEQINVFLQLILPIIFYSVGWLFIYLSLFLETLFRKKIENPKERNVSSEKSFIDEDANEPETQA